MGMDQTPWQPSVKTGRWMRKFMMLKFVIIYIYTHTHQDWAHTMLPSGKHTKNYGTSPFLSSVDQLFRLVHFSIAKC